MLKFSRDIRLDGNYKNSRIHREYRIYVFQGEEILNNEL